MGGFQEFENRLWKLEVWHSVILYRRRHVDLGRVQKRDQAIDLGPRLLSAPQNAQERHFSLPLLGSQARLRRRGGLPSGRKYGSLNAQWGLLTGLAFEKRAAGQPRGSARAPNLGFVVSIRDEA